MLDNAMAEADEYRNLITPGCLTRLLSQLQMNEIVSPLDSDAEFRLKRARLLAVASRIGLTDRDVSSIRTYIECVLATNDDDYMKNCWHSLLGYVMSVGNGPSGRTFFSALLRTLPQRGIAHNRVGPRD
jgi:hypothetical protein